MTNTTDGGKSPPKSTGQISDNIILNVVLTFIHSLMMRKDKTFIQEATVSGFSLTDIKKAREIIFTHSDPVKKYSYAGPHTSTEAQRAVHAFDGVFKKLTDLDATKKLPILACPSDVLHLLPEKIGEVHGPCQIKFENLESQMTELKQTFHTFTKIMSKDVAPVYQPTRDAASTTLPASAIHPQTRERINSNISLGKRRKISEDGDDYVSCGDDTVFSENENDFQLPGPARRKAARRDRQRNAQLSSVQKDTNSAADTVPTQAAKPQPRRDVVWGKGKSDTASKFKGAPSRIPQVFLWKCDPGTEDNDVKDYLTNEGISVCKVERASHENARLKSFIVSVFKREDYDKLISGNNVPESIAVRRYWPPRDNNFVRGQSSFKHKLQELEVLSGLGLREGRMSDVSPTPRPSVSHSVENMITNSSPKDQQVDADTRTATNSTG